MVMKSKSYEKLSLSDLEGLKEFNELDLLYKIIEIATDSKKRTEEILGGNKQAGVDVRKVLQDIKLVSEIMRDKIQIRKFKNTDKKNKLDKSIDREKKRIKKEEEKINRLEKMRANSN